MDFALSRSDDDSPSLANKGTLDAYSERLISSAESGLGGIFFFFQALMSINAIVNIEVTQANCIAPSLRSSHLKNLGTILNLNCLPFLMFIKCLVYNAKLLGFISYKTIF